MKIVLLLEGKTEKLGVPAFLRRWLDASINQRVALPSFQFRGVGNYLNDYVKVALRFLEDPACLGVVGLLDWYQSRQPIAARPGREENLAQALNRLQSGVGHQRFRQHFAVHETEAWLLSDPRLFPEVVRRFLPKNDPERINLRHPPSLALDTAYRRAFKNKSYNKIKGASLLTQLDPDLAASRCPHLKLLLDSLLQLASCPPA